MRTVNQDVYRGSGIGAVSQRGETRTSKTRPCCVCGRDVWNRYTGNEVACTDCRTQDPWLVKVMKG